MKTVHFSRAAIALLMMLLTTATAWADIEGNGTKDEPFMLKTAADWATFAANVNAGTNADKYYKLDDSWDNSANAVTATVGTSDHPFTGTLDGNGQTLTVSISDTSNQGTAPFRYISGGAVIRNLTVTGSVTGTTHAAGLVGLSKDGSAESPNIIEGCTVNVNVTVNTGSNQHMGGVVGHGLSSYLKIKDTVFSGTMTNGGNFAGGLQGWSDGNHLTIDNCIFTGSYSGSGSFHPIAIHNSGSATSATVSRCYYTAAPTLTDAAYIAVAGTPVYTSTPSGGLYGPVTTLVGNYFEPVTISGINSYYLYTGDNIDINYTVTAADGTVLTKGTDYTETLSPSTVQAKGDYTLTVTAKDGSGYSGAQTFHFTVVDGTPVTSETTEMTTGSIYVVRDEVSIDSRITVSGNVILFLYDNCTLNATKGINVSASNSLTINAESTGDNMGTLIAAANTDDCAGIGGELFGSGGTITINGGKVTANGGDYAAGIGGGYKGADGTITISGGEVTATGGSCGAGIGGGYKGADGTITISGGEVTATGGDYGAGIGGGLYGSGGTITINGGEVTANGGCSAAGIGGGQFGSGGTITLSYTTAESSVYASSYNGTVSIEPNKAFTDGENTYTSETPSETLAALTGKTLTPQQFNITVSEYRHGTVTAQEKALFCETVNLAIAPDEGCLILSVTYNDGTDHTIIPVDNNYSFTMPASDVTITVTLLPVRGSCGTNVNWALTDEDTDGTYETLTISGTGAIADYDSDTLPWADSKADITTVVIGDGVTSIGDYVFSGCSNLANINVVANNENYTSDNGVLFNKDKTTLIQYPIGNSRTDYIIPASVTSIGNSAFSGCTNLALVYVLRSTPSITTLGANAFDDSDDGLVIVVPVDAYDAYTSGWSQYSSNLSKGYTFTCGTGITASTTNNGPLVQEGEEVTVSGMGEVPAGYAFSGYSVKDTGDNGVAVTETNGVYTFTMPASDVTVSAIFAPDPAHFSDDGNDEYTIKTAEGWGVFCDFLQDNDTYNRFSGKTVKLDANIGTAQDPITRMAGSGTNPFCGNFNGGGNKLTFSATAADNYCAPFANVQGGSTEAAAITISNLNVKTTITAADYRHTAGLIALQSGHVNVSGCNATVTISSSKGTNNPTDLYPAGLVSQAFSDNDGTLTVSGCTATGTISTDGKYAAGLVGIVQGAASISDCVSSVTINSSIKGDGTHGGIIAVVNGSGTITGCVFNGKLLTTGETATGNCAGFIAWGNGTISNCLYAPAAIEGDEAEVVAGTGDYPSGTFYRGTAPTVTNCYYTRLLGNAQGKALLTVTAGDNVIIEAISPVGEPTSTDGYNGVYSVSGITAYAKGITRTVEETTTFYYGQGDDVSLTLTSSAPVGYACVYTPTSGSISGSDNPYTLHMPNRDVTISRSLRSTGKAVDVSYMLADGTPQTAQAIALDGTETSHGQSNQEKWYFVGTDISHAQPLTLYGNVHLILADGCNMSVTTTDDYCIYADGHSLHIYGQTEGTGVLNARTQGRYSVIGIFDGILGIHGGNVTATVDGTSNAIYVEETTDGYALIIDRGTLTATASATANKGAGISINGGNACINGGQVEATGGNCGIDVMDFSTAIPGTLTLGGGTLKVSRFNMNSGYSYAGTLAVADGYTYTDGTTLYNSATPSATLAALTNVTLQPCLVLADNASNDDVITNNSGKTIAVQLAGRTLWKDGAWNTLCLPFDVSATSGTLSGDGVVAMTLNTVTSGLNGSTLTLNFTQAETITAGTPFIIKWDEGGTDIVNPVFSGVSVSNASNNATIDNVLTFTGTYAPVSIGSDGDNTLLYLGMQNKLYWPNAAMTIGCQRAYFQLLGGLTAGEPTDPNAPAVRAFNLNFGEDEAAGITTTDFTDSTDSDGAWYDLNGRKLDGVPTRKGIYIHGGKKVVIK